MKKRYELEKYNTITEVKKAIKKCEGRHTQQVAYSTYHDGLTQICFDCGKIRTNIRPR